MIKFYRRNSEDKQRGSALMEFCILTSCLLLFILQVVDVANLLIHHMALTQISREVGRALIGNPLVSTITAAQPYTTYSTSLNCSLTPATAIGEVEKIARNIFLRNVCANSKDRYRIKDEGKVTITPVAGGNISVVTQIKYRSILSSNIFPFDNFEIQARVLAPIL
jgi:hypothetical protein